MMSKLYYCIYDFFSYIITDEIVFKAILRLGNRRLSAIHIVPSASVKLLIFCH